MKKKYRTSSVYDCTVEDVEYIYNKLSIHIFNSKSRPPSCCCHNVTIVTNIRHLGSDGYAVTSSTLQGDPPIKRNHRCIQHQKHMPSKFIFRHNLIMYSSPAYYKKS